MKKLIAAFLALCLACSMAACAGGTTSESSTASTSSTSSESSVAEESVASEEPSSSDVSEASSEGSDTAEATVLSHEEYMAAELDSKVVIEASVQAKQSWWEDKATVYAQDEDGAYFLYNMACSKEDYEKLVPGATIQVTGYKTEWSGEVEIIDATFEFVDGEFIAEPFDATELLGKDELIDHQNQLATFKGLTVEPAGKDADGNDVAFLYNWDGSGSEGDDLYFNVSYNGQTYSFVVESYLCDASSDVYAAVKALEIGQTIDAEGFLYWYEGVNPHITSVTVAE